MSRANLGTAATLEPPRLGYTYSFEAHDLDAIRRCVEEHGFAIARKVIDGPFVERLKAAVWAAGDPERKLAHGGAVTVIDFVERAPAAWDLFEHQPWMALHRALLGSDDLTVHRSACIIRMPGNGGCPWHTDFAANPHAPRNANDVLNAHEHPNGKWFYLTGSSPDRGGLAVIPGSHRLDWPGPEGFVLTPDRKTFHRPGSNAEMYAGMDVPGQVPVVSEPGDMVIFAARTYHAAYPNPSNEVRLSCGMGFRPKATPFAAPWKLPEHAQAFLAKLPAKHRRYFDGYTGIDTNWRPAD